MASQIYKDFLEQKPIEEIKRQFKEDSSYGAGITQEYDYNSDYVRPVNVTGDTLLELLLLAPQDLEIELISKLKFDYDRSLIESKWDNGDPEEFQEMMKKGHEMIPFSYKMAFIQSIPSNAIDIDAIPNNFCTTLLSSPSSNIMLLRLLCESGMNINDMQDFGVDMTGDDDFEQFNSLSAFCGTMKLPKLATALQNPCPETWRYAFDEAIAKVYDNLQEWEIVLRKHRGQKLDMDVTPLPTVLDLKVLFGFVPPEIFLQDVIRLADEGKHDEAIAKAQSGLLQEPELYKGILFELAEYYSHIVDLEEYYKEKPHNIEDALTKALETYELIEPSSPYYKKANENCWRIVGEALGGIAKATPTHREFQKYLLKYSLNVEKSETQAFDKGYIDKLFHELSGGAGDIEPMIPNIVEDPKGALLIAADKLYESAQKIKELEQKLAALNSTSDNTVQSSPTPRKSFPSKGGFYAPSEKDKDEENTSGIYPK